MTEIEKDIKTITKENIVLQGKVDDLNRGMQNLMKSCEGKDKTIRELKDRLNKARDLIDHLTAVYV